MKYIIIALLFTSCVTQRRVKSWLDNHPTEAAGYCADKFPPDTTTKTIFQQVDSSGYNEANSRLSSYADSLFYRLDSLQHVAPTKDRPCPHVINLDSLRKEVDREVKRRLVPCVDSVQHVYHTVINRARETQLQGIIEQKDKTIGARDKRITELETKVKAGKKWFWLFWAVVALIGLTIFLRLKRKLPFVILIFLFASCLDRVELPRELPDEKDTIPVKPKQDTLVVLPDSPA